jgi:hypothetical protein
VRQSRDSRATLLWAVALVTAFVLAGGPTDRAAAEQTQRGALVSSLDGELRPLTLPRDRPAPVAVHLEGRLRTANGSLLPRVTEFEIGLPAQGILSTRGLPVCPLRRLHDTRTGEALAACGEALVGRGRLDAVVALPGQTPFPVRARLLAFNSRVHGRRAVLLQAGAGDPPTSSVLPMLVRPGAGRFGTKLVGRIATALGPWPRLRSFEITLHRRYAYRGHVHSYISASCPLPPALTAGFFSFARASYKLAGGGGIATGIARSCRARSLQ